jgi:hypothetical protein
MSATEQRTADRYATIVVVGGGCYGGYYVRQLQRAAHAGAIVAERILVVDHDPRCAVVEAQSNASNAEEAPAIPVRFDIAEWQEFFPRYLSDASQQGSALARDAIVPSPLMPHLMAEWLVQRAVDRWPARPVTTRAFDRLPRVPWERAGADGTHYVSFATWTCPINCIEPRICPVTRDVRDWSLPVALETHRTERRITGDPIEVAVMHCRHRAYGVGMFDTADVLAADELIRSAGARAAAEVIIGTVSHCHGALTRLMIGPVAA